MNETKDTPQRRHVLKKRSLGLCGYVGCHEKTGEAYYCLEHRAYMSAGARKSYYARQGRPTPEVKRAYQKLDNS